MAVQITLACRSHSSYKAIRQPLGDCAGCWAVWRAVNGLRTAPMAVGLRYQLRFFRRWIVAASQ